MLLTMHDSLLSNRFVYHDLVALGIQPFLDLILQRRSGVVVCHCYLHDATLLFYHHCTVSATHRTIGKIIILGVIL